MKTRPSLAAFSLAFFIGHSFLWSAPPKMPRPKSHDGAPVHRRAPTPPNEDPVSFDACAGDAKDREAVREKRDEEMAQRILMEPLEKQLQDPKLSETQKLHLKFKIAIAKSESIRANFEKQNEFNREGYAQMRFFLNEESRLHGVLPKFPLQHSKATGFHTSKDILTIKVPDEHPYRFFKHSSLPIYYIAFGNDYTQGLSMDRLSFFSELSKGIVKSDKRLISARANAGGLIAAGHNVSFETIAAFFNEANTDEVALNIAECRLREELSKSGVLKLKNGKFEAIEAGALISSVKNGERLHRDRDPDFDHEFNHALYWADEKYHEAAKNLWSNFSPEESAFVNAVFDEVFSSYNLQDEDLLRREFIAYFRDPIEFKEAYLKPFQDRYVRASERERKEAKMSRYLDNKGNLNPDALKIMNGLFSKVISIDKASDVYR